MCGLEGWGVIWKLRRSIDLENNGGIYVFWRIRRSTNFKFQILKCSKSVKMMSGGIGEVRKSGLFDAKRPPPKWAHRGPMWSSQARISHRVCGTNLSGCKVCQGWVGPRSNFFTIPFFASFSEVFKTWCARKGMFSRETISEAQPSV